MIETLATNVKAEDSKALRLKSPLLRRFSDPLVDSPVKTTPIPIYV